MDESYFNEERKRVLRFQAGFLRLNEMAKDLIQVKLPIKLGFAPDPAKFKQQWRDWCYECHEFIRRYRFWMQQNKEPHGDPPKDVLIFADCDVTCFKYLKPEICPDCPGFDKLGNLRNKTAHRTMTEFADILTFEEHFRELEDITDVLFKVREFCSICNITTAVTITLQ